MRGRPRAFRPSGGAGGRLKLKLGLALAAVALLIAPAAGFAQTTTIYGYDALGRLTGTCDSKSQTGFSYDGAGHLTQVVVAVATNLWANPQDGTQWGGWGTTVASAGTLAGANAFEFTVAQSGTVGAIIGADAGVLPGESATSAITLEAVGTVTTDYFGIYGSATNWGQNAASTAAIVSGPGTMTQVAGGLWMISGLSTSQATTVSVTRTFPVSDTTAAIFYIHYTNASQAVAGDAVILAGPSFTSATNQWPNPQDGTQWGGWGTTVASDGTLGGANAFEFTVAQSGTVGAIIGADASVLPGESATSAITLEAVGSVTTDYFGIYGSATYWGQNAASTAAIVSGPGTVTQVAGGLWMISGLSISQATTVSVTRTFPVSDTTAAIFYIHYTNASQAVAGDAVILAGPSFITWCP
jgi:YD repeat-containing protein